MAELDRATAYVGDRDGGKSLQRDGRPDQRDMCLQFEIVALEPGGQLLDLFQCGTQLRAGLQICRALGRLRCRL